MAPEQLTIPEARTKLEDVRARKRQAIADERNQEETVKAVADLLSGLRGELKRRVKARRDLEDAEELLVSRQGVER